MLQFCYLILHLGIDTVSCRLLQQMLKMNMDWNLKKLGIFFPKITCSACKIHQKKYLWLALPDETCLISSSQNWGILWMDKRIEIKNSYVLMTYRLDFRRLPGAVLDPPGREGMSAGQFSPTAAGNRAYMT